MDEKKILKSPKRKSVVFKTPNKNKQRTPLAIKHKTPRNINRNTKLRNNSTKNKENLIASNKKNISTPDNGKINQQNKLNKKNSDNPKIQNRLDNIHRLNEQQTISELNKTLNKILEQNAMANTVESQNINDIENLSDILKKFFGLEIERLNKNTIKFLFQTQPNIKSKDEIGKTEKGKGRRFVFSLADDVKYPESYCYELIESVNIKLPGFLSADISFKKEMVVRFFMEVFLALSATDK